MEGMTKRILFELSMHRIKNRLCNLFIRCLFSAIEVRFAQTRVSYTIPNHSWKTSNNN
jgi:hypothetical protein